MMVMMPTHAVRAVGVRTFCAMVFAPLVMRTVMLAAMLALMLALMLAVRHAVAVVVAVVMWMVLANANTFMTTSCATCATCAGISRWGPGEARHKILPGRAIGATFFRFFDLFRSFFFSIFWFLCAIGATLNSNFWGNFFFDFFRFFFFRKERCAAEN
jgi:hypothetical protein